MVDVPYKMGFMGTTSDEVLFTAQPFVKGNVFMPFTGSAKDISVLSEEGRSILSYDTQYLSKAIVDGIFNAQEGHALWVDTLQAEPTQGYAFNNRIKRMDDAIALWIDGVMSMEGCTDYMRAAMCRCLIQGTVAGRLTHWDRSLEQLVASYERSLEANRAFTRLPGEREHEYCSVYSDLDNINWGERNFETMWIDPPKVIDTQDVYSRNFVWLNSCLTQKTEELPKWKHLDMIPRLKQLWALPVPRIIQFYCSDVRPTDDQVRTELEKIGSIVERIRVRHQSRADYIYVVEKDIV